MGHIIQHISVNGEKDIIKAAANWFSLNCDRNENPKCIYPANQMHIIRDVVCDSYEDAVKYLQEICRNRFYYDAAVRYKDVKHLEDNEAITKLKYRLNQMQEGLQSYKAEHSVHKRASAFIGCPKCMSKLANDKFSSETCPVCNSDLRSASVLNAIIKKQDDIYKLKTEISEEIRKHDKKLIAQAPMKWLAKVEAHC